jgi:hypothetical protein
MIRRGRFAAAGGVLAAGMLLGGCPRPCSQIGCVDQAELKVRRTGGAPAAFAITVEFDGQAVDCAAPAADAAVAICATSRPASSLNTPTGRHEQLVIVQGAPARFRVVLRDGGAVVAERTFEPRYRTSQPNGPDCEPTCHQWSDVWEVP